MRIISKDEIVNSIKTPPGELIYELIGASQTIGGAVKHSLAHVVIPPHRSSAAHYHKISEETYYMLAGEGRMIIDGESFTLRPGQACLIMPGEVHQIFNEQDRDLAFLAICAPAWTADDSLFVDG